MVLFYKSLRYHINYFDSSIKNDEISQIVIEAIHLILIYDFNIKLILSFSIGHIFEQC